MSDVTIFPDGLVERDGRDAHDVTVNNDAAAVAGRVYENMLKAGVVVRLTGRSIVIAPPRIITEVEVDEIRERPLRALDASIDLG